jgi:ectoine hydroxylase-related dioxygenase (phytanoyl-CoA dioxygenase family)
LKAGERFPEYITEVVARQGDVVIFTETTTHGSLPWKANQNRRALLYKFSPGHSAYGTITGMVEYPEFVHEMTPEQRAVMQAPSIRRANL